MALLSPKIGMNISVEIIDEYKKIGKY